MIHLDSRYKDSARNTSPQKDLLNLKPFSLRFREVEPLPVEDYCIDLVSLMNRGLDMRTK